MVPESCHRIVSQVREAYVLRDEARAEWQHSIPAVATLRYSITFRTLRRPRTER